MTERGLVAKLVAALGIDHEITFIGGPRGEASDTKITIQVRDGEEFEISVKLRTEPL